MPDADMHLSDELISAALDGELTAAEQAEVDTHIPRCAECSARLDAFRAVAGAVGAFEATAVAPKVVPLERKRRRVGPPLAWLAAAAAAVMLLAGIAGLVRTTEDSDEMASVASDTAAQAEEKGADTEGFAAGGGSASAGVVAAAEPLDGGDLGDRSEPEDVAALVRAALDSGVRSVAPTAAMAASDDAEAGPTPAGAPATTAPPPGRPCVDEARASGGEQLGLLRYVALLRYRGTPAVLLAFDRNDGGRQAFVMALSGCAVLAEPRL